MNGIGSVIIRRASTADAPRLAQVEKACFAAARYDRFTAADFRDLARNGTCGFFGHEGRYSLFVAEYNGYPAAYVLAMEEDGDGAPSPGIASIAVDPAYRHKGLGRRLLAFAEKEMTSRAEGPFDAVAEVHPENGASLALFMAAGYRRQGAIPDYYRDGSPAIILTKRLEPPRPDMPPLSLDR